MKIFRSFRLGNIDSKKVGKYLLYALGEIVLVVIGILIALQINIVKEKSKLDERTQDYYSLLCENLDQDIIYIEETILKLDSNQVKYETYRESFEAPNLSPMEIMENMKKTRGIYPILNFHSSTTETLENTGDIKLISPDIRVKLIELKKTQQKLIDASFENSKLSLQMGSETLLKLGSPELMSTQSNQTILAEYYKNETIQLETIMSSEASLSIRHMNDMLVKTRLEKMLGDIKVIRDEIERKLTTPKPH